jgi:hypothetical protein
MHAHTCTYTYTYTRTHMHIHAHINARTHQDMHANSALTTNLPHETGGGAVHPSVGPSHKESYHADIQKYERRKWGQPLPLALQRWRMEPA